MSYYFKKPLAVIMAVIILFTSFGINILAANDGEIIKGVLKNGLISDYEYSDEYFSRDTYTYYEDTALIAMNFALTSMYNENGSARVFEQGEVPEVGVEFLNHLGYETVKTYGFDTEFTLDGTACIIGLKNIDKKDESIIAVSIRGAKYEWEWGGNFRVGTGDDHEGFMLAKEAVENYLADFINDTKSSFNSDVKIWITGFSRSAAAGNFLAAALDDKTCNVGYDFEPENVYAYLFETPMNTINANAQDSLYGNIFNVINPIDLVPKIMPSAWGYRRYGKDYLLPAKENDENYDVLRSKMEEEYYTVSKMKYYEDFSFYKLKSRNDVISDVITASMLKNPTVFKVDPDIGQGGFLDGMIDILANEIIQTPENYIEKYETFMIKLMSSIVAYDGNFEFTGSVEEIMSFVMSFLLKNIMYIFINPVEFKENFRQALALYLSKTLVIHNPYYPEGITYDEIYVLLGELDKFIVAAINHPDHFYSLYKYLTAKTPDGDFLLFLPHYQEIELAWMRALAQD